MCVAFLLAGVYITMADDGKRVTVTFTVGISLQFSAVGLDALNFIIMLTDTFRGMDNNLP